MGVKALAFLSWMSLIMACEVMNEFFSRKMLVRSGSRQQCWHSRRRDLLFTTRANDGGGGSKLRSIHLEMFQASHVTQSTLPNHTARQGNQNSGRLA